MGKKCLMNLSIDADLLGTIKNLAAARNQKASEFVVDWLLRLGLDKDVKRAVLQIPPSAMESPDHLRAWLHHRAEEVVRHHFKDVS